MGYVRDRIYRLKFTDDEYCSPETGDPLEVRVRPMSIGVLDMVGELTELRERKLTAADIKRIFELFELFAEHLVSWNLEDDKGEPVPTTVDGVRAQDLDFGLMLMFAWLDAVTGVPAPLAQPSSGGVSYPAVSIPMETLSPSPVS
ncbi:MAG TPA: hypothetical protein VFB74_34115 [Kribbellaceae bacterium]|nr:hypothetical protein [Kribbellaceae bacterium]